MNNLLNTQNGYLTLIVIATSLCDRYDEWKHNDEILKIVNLNDNVICNGLKQLYPSMDNKTVQSIALAFSIYFLFLTESKSNYEMLCNADLSVD